MATFSRSLDLILTVTDNASKTIAKSMAGISANSDAFYEVGAGLTALGAALSTFGIFAVKSAGELQSLKMGLNAVSGSSEETERQLVRLKEVAKLPGLGFREAIQGSINLQAAGMSAELSERALKSFGNALATVGKGKSELDGVINALTQISAKGKVSAEEILQLSERLPQIRVAMKDAFGTSNTEALAQMGIDSEMFIEKITAQFEKLPKVTGGFKNSMENINDSFFRFKATIGEKLLPYIEKFSESLAKVLEKMTEWVSKHPDLTKSLLVFGTALTVSLVAIGGLLISIAALSTLFVALAPVAAMVGLSLAGLIGIIAAIPLAIAAVITIGYLLWKHWDEIKAKAGEIWGAILEFLKNTWENIKTSVVSVFTSISDFLKSIWDTITGAIKFAVAFIAGLVIAIFDAMGIDIIAVFGGIKDWLISSWETIKNAFNAALEFVKQIWNTAWAAISEFLSPIWEKIKSVIGIGWNWIKDTFNKLTKPITDAWGSLWQGLTSTASGAWETVKNTVKSSINWIITQINKLIESINGIARSGAGAIGVSIPQLSKIPMLAQGGIVTRPTLAMIGEAGAEAVVPLNRAKGLGGGVIINVYGDVSGQEVVEKVKEAITKELSFNQRFNF